jgi:hypothetical protein
MKVVIKEVAEKGDKNVITPQTFSCIDWIGKEVTGLKYYVDKAVKLGATKPKPKSKKVK